MTPKHWLTIALTCLLVTACQAQTPWVEVQGQRFTVEIADDDASRARGLMFRDHLPADHGMLFMWRQEAPRAFWMRNTRIPLDIIYLDRDFVVVDIAHNARPCRTPPCRSYPSAKPAQYVLEINGGLSAELGLNIGDRIVVGALPQ
jgi:uncharacterized membrane protein (UPF0127 family)